MYGNLFHILQAGIFHNKEKRPGAGQQLPFREPLSPI